MIATRGRVRTTLSKSVMSDNFYSLALYRSGGGVYRSRQTRRDVRVYKTKIIKSFQPIVRDNGCWEVNLLATSLAKLCSP